MKAAAVENFAVRLRAAMPYKRHGLPGLLDVC
jgi:hypothetical protein